MQSNSPLSQVCSLQILSEIQSFSTPSTPDHIQPQTNSIQSQPRSIQNIFKPSSNSLQLSPINTENSNLSQEYDLKNIAVFRHSRLPRYSIIVDKMNYTNLCDKINISE